MASTEKHKDVESAKRIVEQELKLRIAGQHLPPEINILLNHAWKEVLIDIYLEEGSQAMRWQLSLEITEELLWSLAPKTSSIERKQMAEMLPLLVKVLRQGLNTVISNEDTVDSLMRALHNYHMECLRGENIFVKKAAPKPVKKPAAAQPARRVPGGMPSKATVAGPYCQIEMLDIVSVEEVMDEASAESSGNDLSHTGGWVYRAATNEWVFIGEPKVAVSQNVAARAAKPKKASVLRTRKMDEGDK